MNENKKIKIKQPPILFDNSQKIIESIEKELGGTLITYWNNPNGSVCDNDVIAFYELLETIGPKEKIYLFIKSSGGQGETSLRIINLIRKYSKEIIVLIPLDCASAATMMAIGANEIRMGPMAYLTAVDTSLTHDLSPIDRDNDRVSVSLDELNRIIKIWQKEKSKEAENPYKSLFEYVHPLVIGAVDRAESLSIMLCKELLSYHISEEKKAVEIASTLNSKYPSHSYPILLEEAKKIGLNVKPLSKEANNLLLGLNEIYSEMGQKATSDYNEVKAHGNEILNILETKKLQIYFQQDKDWFYRVEERRWVTMNDHSGWRKIENNKGKMKKSIFHVS